MLELEVQELQELKPIDFNFEELKKELSAQLDKYKNIAYTEETMKIATEDRAKLNKLAKAINDRKIEIHKEWDKPYSEFEGKIKIILSMINEPLTLIDKQVKDFEQKQKDDKRAEIEEFFNTKVGDFVDLIKLDNIFNEKWLNKTYKMSTIQTDIEHIFAKTTSDLTVIDGQIKDETVCKQVKAFYFNNISNSSVLSLSLQEGMKIIESNKKLEELQQKKAESSQNIVQNVTKSEENVTKSEENLQKTDKSLQNNTEITQIDFRVWATQKQLMLLKEFLINNNIKYGRVE